MRPPQNEVFISIFHLATDLNSEVIDVKELSSIVQKCNQLFSRFNVFFLVLMLLVDFIQLLMEHINHV